MARGIEPKESEVAELRGELLKRTASEAQVHAEALALYRGAGYAERGPFGEYAPDPLSHFFEKSITPVSGRLL